MKNFMKITLVAMFMLAAMAATSGIVCAQEGGESPEYNAALDEWAKGVAEARERAYNTHVNFKLVKAQSASSTPEEGVHPTLMESVVRVEATYKNTSEFPFKASAYAFSFKDENGHFVDYKTISEPFTVMPGETTVLKMAVRYTYKNTGTNGHMKFAQGKAVGQVSFDDLKIMVDGEWKEYDPFGEPWAPTKPRAPYWYTDQMEKVAVGRAQTKHGLYFGSPKLPEQPWFKVYGANGQFSGTIPHQPGQEDKTSIVYTGSTSAQPNVVGAPEGSKTATNETGEFESAPLGEEASPDEDLTVGSAVEGASDAVKTANQVKNIFNSLGGLFN